GRRCGPVPGRQCLVPLGAADRARRAAAGRRRVRPGHGGSGGRRIGRGRGRGAARGPRGDARRRAPRGRAGPGRGGQVRAMPPAERRAGPGRGEQVRENWSVIERYTLPEMGRIWSQEHKYELWCRVETLVLEAHASAGTVPADAVGPVRAAPPPTPEAVAAAEAVTDHDVIAFLTAWADNTVPRSAAAYVHFGMTSSDLLDTALAVTLTEATDLLITRATALVAVLREHALAHRGTIRAGRTHGIHAEP